MYDKLNISNCIKINLKIDNLHMERINLAEINKQKYNILYINQYEDIHK